MLEERVLLAAQPVVTVAGDLQPLIGEQAQLTITFDNQPDGTPGSAVGYAPYVDLILPQNGADGAGTGSTPPNENDGVSFVSASYLGASLSATVLEFDANGQATHPFARDATGALRVVNAADYGAAAGDQLVVLRLPFGSFVPEQPTASIQVTVDVSALADLNTPLPVTAVGGFAFGRDALDNPTADPPVLGTPVTAPITPSLFTVGKVFDGAEGETATGPNFQRSYTISLDLATGQSVTNASLLDTLPDGIVIVGSPTLSVPGTVTYDPVAHTILATLDGTVTGVAGVDATLTINFYVAETLAPGAPSVTVLDPVSGGPRTLENNLSARANWDPVDDRDDPLPVVFDPPGPEAVFVARSIATQKGQSILVDANAPGLGPGDTLEYVIDVQISDYFDMQDLVLRDLLSDGQAYVEGSARLDVVEAGSALGSGAFAPGNISVVRDPTTGATAFRFNVSDQLVAGGAPDGVLQGGEGGLGATTLRITYQAVVERFFLGSGQAVGQGDTLSNTAVITAAVVDANGVPTGGTPDDGTSSSGTIATGGVTKTVYAVNGVTPTPGPLLIAAGDLITFRLTYDLPQTLTTELRLTDFLPLPVFDVDNFTLTLDNTVSPDVPGVNVAKWGPLAGGFSGLLTVTPELLTDSEANSLTFVFRDLAPAVPVATTADILFTIRVADRPFGDGLLLTNQVSATEVSTTGTRTTSDAITQVTLTEPTLQITKGIIATNNPQGDLSPGTVGPVAFTAPGSSGVRFSGTINSANLALTPVDSDLSDVDSGDRVSFAIVVENIGTGRNGAYDVRITDTLPQGYRIGAGGLNLQVTNGAGVALAFTGDLFAGGIILTDPPGAPTGALAPADPASGANVLVITYDLEITETPQPRSQITNLAEIDNYAAIEGGIDRVPSTTVPTLDVATTRIGDPSFDKVIVSTSLEQTGSGQGNAQLDDLAIGEQVTFDLTATLREGRIVGFEIADLLPSSPGELRFVSAEVVSIGGNIFVRDPLAGNTAGAPLPDPVISQEGSLIRFSFANDIVNLPDNVVDDNDRIVVRVTAVVTNVPGNVAGTQLQNVGTLAFQAAGQTVTIQDSVVAEVVLPSFAPSKTADVEVVQGGDIVTYTVGLTSALSNFAGPAFDIVITDDLLPGALTLIAGSITLVTTPAGGASFTETGGVITVTAPVLLPGETIRFTYQARVEPTVGGGTQLPNTADFRGDSHPGIPPTGDADQRVFLGSASDSVRVPGVGIVKTVSVADTSLPETGASRFDPQSPDLAIGEIVTYRIVVSFPEAVSSNVTVTDFLPGSILQALPNTGLFEYLSAAIVRVGANLTVTGLGNLPVASDRGNADGILDTVVFDLGTVTNAPDGVFDAGDEIEFTVTARVRDAAANAAGRAPINVAEVDFRTGTARASAAVDIVEPFVRVDKTSSAASGDAGDRIAYQLRLPVGSINAGPAYDVVVTDTVPVGIDIDLATLRFAGAPLAGATLAYDGATRTITATLPVYLREDPEVVIAYEAVVANSVRPDEVLVNTATVTFDSHPGDPGDVYQRDYGPFTDSQTFTVGLPSLSKRVVSTDIPSTQFAQLQPLVQDVAIGETVTYLVTLRLPEVTTNLVVTDQLPRADGAPPTAGDMEWIASRIVSIGGNIILAPGAPGVGNQGVVSDPNDDGILDRIVWNFGLVTNLADNIENADDLIVFEVVARVPNLPTNQPGDVLINLAQAQYSRADGSTRLVTQTEAIEIVAPRLDIDKTPSIASGDAGDLVTYTVTVSHEALSTSDAFGLVLTDLLDPRLSLVAGTVTTSIAGATVVSGNTAGDTTVRVDLAQLRGPDALLPAETFTVTYQARLTDAVRPGTTVPNTADLGWQSAPIGFPEARPDADSDSASVAVILANAIEKAVVATSLPETGDGFFDPTLPDLAIGETVTYEIRIRLGEGTERVLVQDVLPAGMVFVSGSVVSIGANISNTAIGVGAAPVVSGGNITFDFGNDVTDSGDNVQDDADVIVMRVTARVLPGVNAGDVLTNNATLTNNVDVISATAPVEVVEPAVTITKTPSVATGDAGDEVTFTVVIAQGGSASAPLYDLEAQDILPPGYALVAGSAAATRGTVTEAGNTVRLTLTGAALLPTDDPQTQADENRIVLTYRAVLVDAVQPGQVVTNVIAFSGSSAPGGGATTETYTGRDDAVVTVTMPVAIDKTIIATSLPESGTGQGDPTLTDLAVGETVTYRLVATLSEGTQTLVIRDTLPAGLEVLSATLAALGSGVTAAAPTITIVGQVVTFDFGTVVNAGNNIAGDGTVAVDILARVRDVPGNVAGTTLTNAGEATITSPDNPTAPGGTEQATGSTTAEVVEPELVIDKTVPPAFLRPNETVTYTVTLTHAAGSTAAAYDIVLADLLGDPYLDLVAGSVTTSAGSVTLGNGVGDSTVRIDVPVLALGETLTVTFTARVAADAPGGVTLANTVVADFDSAGGPGGRPDSVTDGTQTPGVPSLVKQIVATSNPDTGSGAFDPTIPDLAVGETLTYRLTITLPQGTTEQLVLSDLLPDAIAPLAARVVSAGSGLTAGAPAITISGQAVTLAFGTVVNASPAAIGIEDTIVVEVDARVIDLAGIDAGAPLVNAAQANFTIGGREGRLDVTALAELVEPELDIAKQVDRTTGDAGDVFAYTVTIAHAADSTAAAYDIVVTDALDARFVPVAGSVSSSLGTATLVGNGIRLEIPRLLTTDAPVTLTYSVRFADTIEPGQVVGNTAALGWDSNPGEGGRPATDQASAEDITAVFPLNLTKAIVATSLPETGSDRFDPDAPDLAVGETVTYEIVATLSEGTQRLVITDTIPFGLLPLDGQAVVVSTGAGITAGAGGTLTPSAVISGQSVTFDFGTVVNTGNNVSDGGDQVTIRITARVLDLPINTNGRQVENDAQAAIFSPSDPTAPGGTVTAGDSALADIVVPRYLLDKAVDPASGDAGDVFTYTLTLSPAAGTDAPAFNLLVEDPLSPFLVVVPGSVSTSVGTATLAGNTIRIEIPVLQPDAAPVVITYRAAFSDAIEPGQVVPNLARLDYATAPDFGRDLGDDAEASVRGAFGLVLAKEIVATSLPETGSQYFDPTLTDLAAGETVTYRLTATLSEGTQRLVIADTLPAGLIPETARVVALGAGIAAGPPAISIFGGRVVFDFGTVVNTGDNAAGDQVVVEIVARLNAGPDAGAVLTNAAEASVTSPSDPGAPGGTLVARDAVSAEAVAAVLVFDKQAGPATVGLGEPITYTLVLSHAATSTAPAYEVVLSDPLSEASLQLIAGSVVASFGTVVIGNAAGDTGVRVTVPVLLPGQVLTVTFQARAVGIPIPDGIAPNTAGFTSTSAPGDIPPGFLRLAAGQDTASVQIASGTPPTGGSLLGEYDDAFRRIAQNRLNVPAILSGTAQPGAGVALALRDSNGAPITTIGLTADVGGHWVASPITFGAGPQPDGAAFAEAVTLAGRQGGSGGGAALAPAPAGAPAPTPLSAPYSVLTSESPSAFDVRAPMDGVRVTFAGAVQPGGVFTGAPEASGQVAVAPIAASVQRDIAGLTAPGSLAWNRFALDFAASAAVAAVPGR